VTVPSSETLELLHVLVGTRLSTEFMKTRQWSLYWVSSTKAILFLILKLFPNPRLCDPSEPFRWCFPPNILLWICSSLPCVLHVRSSRTFSFSYTSIITWTIQDIEHTITPLFYYFMLLSHKYSSHLVFRRSASFRQSNGTKMHAHIRLDLMLQYCVH
jgi:hypothetical protein